MELNNIKMPFGARKSKKRLGRGSGSGHGKTSCRGHKGLKARTGSGGKLRIGFEGGQMSLIRRVPKRGFRGAPGIIAQIVNVRDLNGFTKDSVIDIGKLKNKGLIKSSRRPVKVLGKGEIKKNLTVRADSFSKGAVEKINKAGGRAEYIGIHEGLKIKD